LKVSILLQYIKADLPMEWVNDSSYTFTGVDFCVSFYYKIEAIDQMLYLRIHHFSFD